MKRRQLHRSRVARACPPARTACHRKTISPGHTPASQQRRCPGFPPMLPCLTVPDSWRVVLETFRPAFRRSSTFGLFALLATGLVARPVRRTVVGMLAASGMAAVVSFHAVCRFFSTHAWDADRLGLALARLIVTR